MKKLNLEIKYDRRGSNSVKWDHKDFIDSRASDKALPLWLSDMEFRVADEIIDALSKRVDHGFFGQSMPGEKYFSSIQSWYYDRFSWKIEMDSIFYSPGVLPAIGFAINSFTKEGDGIIIQPPVFYPFAQLIAENGRKVVNNNLINDDGYYYIDFNDLEDKAKDPNNTMLLLCSPHNPVGRVWKKEELLKIIEICKKYDLTIFSDEIHCDLTRKNVRHYPLMSLGAYNKIVAAVAPSKTFNVGGLPIAQIIIDDHDLKDKWNKETYGRHFIRFAPPLDMILCETAYSHCTYWVDQVMDYVEDNFDFIVKFLGEKLPQTKYKKPEGTFLAWINFGAYVNHKDLMDILITKYDLLIEDGIVFGEQGDGYFRISIACQRDILEEGLNKIVQAINELQGQ